MYAIRSYYDENYIIPDIFNPQVVKKVSAAVADVAYQSGVAKIRNNKLENLTV